MNIDMHLYVTPETLADVFECPLGTYDRFLVKYVWVFDPSTARYPIGIPLIPYTAYAKDLLGKLGFLEAYDPVSPILTAQKIKKRFGRQLDSNPQTLD